MVACSPVPGNNAGARVLKAYAMVDIKPLLNKMTIIVGDVNSGKTRYTLDIIEGFVTGGFRDMAVLDLAPDKVGGIGGKILPLDAPDIYWATTEILAPRLMGGRDQERVMKLARQNREAIEKLFEEYLQDPKDILFVNDVTLYLQAGDLGRLFRVLSTATTQIINGYYGETFADSYLSRRERARVDRLIARCDTTIEL